MTHLRLVTDHTERVADARCRIYGAELRELLHQAERDAQEIPSLAAFYGLADRMQGLSTAGSGSRHGDSAGARRGSTE